MMKRMRNIPVHYDLDKRFAIIDRYPDYVQVLTLSAPPIEEAIAPDLAPEMTRLANDEMSKLCEQYPDRFYGFAASLAMNVPDEIVPEIDRAMQLPGAKGVQIFTNVE